MPMEGDVYEELALDLTAVGGARSVLRLQVEADYFALVDVVTDVLEVSVNDGSYRRLRLGSVVRPRGAISKLAVRNPSGGAVTGTLCYGQGSYIDNRVIVASSGGTLPVGAADGALISLGATTATAATSDAGTFSLIALFKRLLGFQSPASAGAVTSFTSVADAQILAANSARKGYAIFNEGAGDIYVLEGTGTASATVYTVKLATGDFYESRYVGEVRGIFGSAGTARITSRT